jgi:transposase
MTNDMLLKTKIDSFLPNLDEKLTRLYLASEAKILGRGGKQKIATLTKVSRTRINKGLIELEQVSLKNDGQKIRKSGGGRKSKIVEQVGLLDQIEAIVSPHTRGDPMNPLLWTSKSLRQIETALKEKGFTISYVAIGGLLKSLGYSLQANKKTDEGGNVENRNEQFEYINEQCLEFMQSGNPVISVDCKKKELIGNFKNQGREWEEKGNAPEVKVYDFIDKELGKAIPYGVYDIYKNEGWVNVGISSDTAEFAVNSIRTWWYEMGKKQYKNATKLLITADGGGSNSSRGRLWKTELQKLSTELGLNISVCHFPPGTSKWNKIEHRLFSYISKNWRAKPLISIEVIVNLISNTTTEKGLKVMAKKDANQYAKGIKVTDQELAKVNIKRNEFRGDWNYIIKP